MSLSVGLFWFDNSTTTLQVKIQKALDYYHKKYGRMPDLCLVNPVTMGEQKVEIENLTVRPYRPVLPGHLWIGIEDKN